MNPLIEQIECKTGAEMESTAKRIAQQRGLTMHSHTGHGAGLVPKGPSIGLYDANGREQVRVWFRCY